MKLQFRLRTLLIAMTLAGPLLGLAGPPFYRWTQTIRPALFEIEFRSGTNVRFKWPEDVQDDAQWDYSLPAETPLD